MQVIADIAGRVGAGQINEKVDFTETITEQIGQLRKRLAVFIGDHDLAMIEGLVLDLNHFQRMINIQLAHLDMVTPIVGNLARKNNL